MENLVNFAGLTFIFRFLPIFLILYFAVREKYRDTVLLVGSLFFYAAGEPVFLLLLIALTAVNHAVGKKSWEYGTGYTVMEWQKCKKKKLMVFAVALDVAVLVLF